MNLKKTKMMRIGRDETALINECLNFLHCFKKPVKFQFFCIEFICSVNLFSKLRTDNRKREQVVDFNNQWKSL